MYSNPPTTNRSIGTRAPSQANTKGMAARVLRTAHCMLIKKGCISQTPSLHISTRQPTSESPRLPFFSRFLAEELKNMWESQLRHMPGEDYLNDRPICWRMRAVLPDPGRNNAWTPCLSPRCRSSEGCGDCRREAKRLNSMPCNRTFVKKRAIFPLHCRG